VAYIVEGFDCHQRTLQVDVKIKERTALALGNDPFCQFGNRNRLGLN
jgi:hypothetical protein